MLNLAIMKIGARIHENDKVQNSTNEVLATIKLLQLGGASVTAITEILSSDNKNTSFPIKSYNWFEEHINEFDKLIIINGNANFYGGQYTSDVEIYKLMNKFPREIIYFLYDPYLGLTDITKSLKSKEFAKDYNLDDYRIPDKIHYITQCRNVSDINELGQKSIQYFPLELFPIVMEKHLDDMVDFDFTFFDLNYAGSFRGGRRQKSMIKYFFGLPNDIKAFMFGNLKLEQFDTNKYKGLRPPMFGLNVPHDKVKQNIKQGLATVIIGDPLYSKLDDIAQRFAESIIYGQITFIDAEYDLKHRAYHNKELENYLCINSREELISKIREIKNNKKLFYELLQKQKDDLLSNFNKDSYCNDLVNIIYNIKD